MTQTVDPVAHHKAHRACIIIGPDTLASISSFSFFESLRRQIQGLIPRDFVPLAGPFFAFAKQRFREPIFVMDTLGIAGNFRANHTSRIGLLFRPVNASDFVMRQNLHIQGAGGWAIMRAGRKMAGYDLFVHTSILN